MYHATVSCSCSKLDLVLSRLGGQGGLVQVVEVGVVHGSLGRDSLGWVIHLERRYIPDTIFHDLPFSTATEILPASGREGRAQKAPISSLTL